MFHPWWQMPLYLPPMLEAATKCHNRCGQCRLICCCSCGNYRCHCLTSAAAAAGAWLLLCCLFFFLLGCCRCIATDVRLLPRWWLAAGWLLAACCLSAAWLLLVRCLAACGCCVDATCMLLCCFLAVIWLPSGCALAAKTLFEVPMRAQNAMSI